MNPVLLIYFAAVVGVCCCILLLCCCWISRICQRIIEDRAQSPLTYSPSRIPRIPRIWQRDTEGPAQSPPTYSQPSYHTPQQPHITRIGDTAFSHSAGYPLHTTTVQYTTPGKHKPDTDSPPPYSSFQDEAAGVLGLKRGQQTKN